MGCEALAIKNQAFCLLFDQRLLARKDGKMRRRQVILGAGAVLAAPAIHRAAAAEPIVFGGSVPLTGPAAETGLNVNNGYITAVDYINDVLGGVEVGDTKYKLDLKLFDDASDPSRATTLIQRQIDQGTQFFLGSFGSNIVLPTAQIVERARRIMVQTGGGSDAIFTQGFKRIFGMYPRATLQMESTAAWMKSLKPMPATFSVIYTNDAFSKTAATGAINACTEAGMSLLDKFELPEKVTDVSSVLGSVRAKLPDVLICMMHDQDSLLIARQMISSGTNVKMLFQGLGPQLASYREALGKYAEGITTQTYWSQDLPFTDKFFGTASKFAEYYRSKFTRPIAYHTAGAAACIITYLLAMQEVKSTKAEAVRDAVAAADFQTLYGRIKFTKDGDGDPVIMGAMVAQVQGGALKVVFPEAAHNAYTAYPTLPWDKRA
jgi:branched-chain amino acid transport system substrate-binding protein